MNLNLSKRATLIVTSVRCEGTFKRANNHRNTSFSELGANLLGQERVQSDDQGPEEGSTSGVSTVNSVKSQKTSDSLDDKYWKEYRDQMGALKMENIRLLQELIESQKTYQVLLQQVLEEQRAQVNSLTRLCENINRRTMRQESG